MAETVSRGDVDRDRRARRRGLVHTLRRGLLIVGVIGSLALTADQVRAGSSFPTGRPDNGSAVLSLSVPGVFTRPVAWLAAWSNARSEAASLVWFGLGLLGCAQIIARRRGQHEAAPGAMPAATFGPRPPARTQDAQLAPVGAPRRVTT